MRTKWNKIKRKTVLIIKDKDQNVNIHKIDIEEECTKTGMKNT